MSIATRLKHAREKAGYDSAAAAARAHGWIEATYRHHENGTRGFGPDHAAAYGKAFGVSSAWLVGLSVEAKPDELQAIRNIVERFDGYSGEDGDLEEQMNEHIAHSLVRVVRNQDVVRTGTMAFYGHVDKLIAMPTKLLVEMALVNFRDIVAMEVSGNDMSPTINDGETILIDTGAREPTEHDRIWLLSIGGITAIRRLRFRTKATAVAIADCPDLSPMDIDIFDPSFAIHGRVSWTGKRL